MKEWEKLLTVHLQLGPKQSLKDLLITWKDDATSIVSSNCFQISKHNPLTLLSPNIKW